MWQISKKQNLGQRKKTHYWNPLVQCKLTSPEQGGWPIRASLELGFAGPGQHQDYQFCWTLPAEPAASCYLQSLWYHPLWACDCLVLVLARWVFCSALGAAAEPRWQGDVGAASWVSSGHENTKTEKGHYMTKGWRTSGQCASMYSGQMEGVEGVLWSIWRHGEQTYKHRPIHCEHSLVLYVGAKHGIKLSAGFHQWMRTCFVTHKHEISTFLSQLSMMIYHDMTWALFLNSLMQNIVYR